MPKQLVIDCPHAGCGSRNIAADVAAITPINNLNCNVFVTCNACQQGVALQVGSRKANAASPENIHAADMDRFRREYVIHRMFPRRPTPEAIESLPAQVRSAYMQAEEAFTSGSLGLAAAMAYRATIERTLRHLDPAGQGTLYRRIEAMNGTLPAGLIDLLHEVRFLGNDAAHEDEDPSAEDVAAGRDFTRLFLLYMFELPERVNAALARRAAREET